MAFRRNFDFLPARETELFKPEVASNVEGKIEQVIWTTGFNFDSEEGSLWAHRYGDMLKGGEVAGLKLVFLKNLLADLPKDVVLKIIVSKSPNENTKKLISDLSEALVNVGADEKRLQIEVSENAYQGRNKEWARDYWLLANDGQTIYTPNYQAKKDKELQLNQYSETAAEGLGLKRIECPFYFEGGDIRVAESKMFIGLDTILDNLKASKISITLDAILEMAQKFSRWFGMEEVEVVGLDYVKKIISDQSFRQSNQIEKDKMLRPPFFHTDLYFTPLGGGKVAIGDIKQFFRILSESGCDEKNIKYSFLQVLNKLNEQLKGFSKLADFERMLKDCVGTILDVVNSGQSIENHPAIGRIQLFLDRVAEQMEESGFEVIRLPIMPNFGNERTNDRSAMITYNNSLVEKYFDGQSVVSRIWLPSYGANRRSIDNDGRRVPADALDMVDDEARRILKNNGIEPLPIETGFERSLYGGSLNCSLLEKRQL